MSYQPSYRITTKITHLLTNIAEILGEIKYIDSKLNTPKLRKINKIKTITGTLLIDGNGRMGRLWQTLILNNWKSLFQTIPVESVIRDYQQDYYHALQQSGNDGESTVFIEFMLQVILESIQQVTDSI